MGLVELDGPRRGGMKLIGPRRAPESDRTGPPTCGCDYSEIWRMCDQLVRYVITKRCKRCAELEESR